MDYTFRDQMEIQRALDSLAAETVRRYETTGEVHTAALARLLGDPSRAVQMRQADDDQQPPACAASFFT